MIDILQYIDELKEIKKLVEDQKPRYLIVDKINEFMGFKQKEVDEFEKWAEAESQKDAYLGGYSEEHIKQMTDERHNQWGVAGEPKKGGIQGYTKASIRQSWRILATFFGKKASEINDFKGACHSERFMVWCTDIIIN